MKSYSATTWKKGDPIPEKGILLIQHGPRDGGFIATRNHDLTDAGTAAARTMGDEWHGPVPDCIVTSPIKRCRRTGELIADGAGWEIEIFESTLLGNPGPFVVDLAEVNEALDVGETEFAKFFRDQVEGKQMPGMLELDLGSKRLIGDLEVFSKGGLMLGISHDTVIGGVMAYFGLDVDRWPEPLCGIRIE